MFVKKWRKQKNGKTLRKTGRIRRNKIIAYLFFVCQYFFCIFASENQCLTIINRKQHESLHLFLPDGIVPDGTQPACPTHDRGGHTPLGGTHPAHHVGHLLRGHQLWSRRRSPDFGGFNISSNSNLSKYP